MVFFLLTEGYIRESVRAWERVVITNHTSRVAVLFIIGHVYNFCMEMKYGNMAGNGSNSKVEEMQLYQGMCDSIRSRI